jgi:hypothetical protein
LAAQRGGDNEDGDDTTTTTGAGTSASGAGTSGDDPADATFIALMDMLLTTAMGTTAMVLLRVGVLVYWSRYANKRYYQQTKQIAPKPNAYAKFQAKLIRKQTSRIKGRLSFRRKPAFKGEKPPAKFKPLPDSLVFPNLEIMLLAGLAMGLTEAAAAAICDEGCVSPACKWTASLVLAWMGTFTVLLCVLSVRFYLHYNKHCWWVHSSNSLHPTKRSLHSRCSDIVIVARGVYVSWSGRRLGPTAPPMSRTLSCV